MKHILVIRLSALGDVALLAPLMHQYSQANADLRFTVAGPPLLEPLFSGMSNVTYLGLKKRQSFIKIYKALLSVGADTVIDLHKVNRVGFALTLLRLRHLFNFSFRIYALRKGRLSRWLFLHHLCIQPRRRQYERYQDVFSRAGIAGASSVPLLAQTNGTPSIGIAPFAQHPGKVWPWPQVQQLVALLSEKGYRVLLFGSANEAPQLQDLANSLPNVESVAGQYPFAKELEIIASLGLMVSMDSANMHFASALGIPVVSIWGATHPDFGFYGYGQDRANALCAGLPCQPCSAFGNKPCRYGDHRCLQTISPEAVVARIKSIISLTP